MAKHSNEANRWYGLEKWKRKRKRQLKAHPLCKLCLDKSLVVPASVVDHVEPHRGDKYKFDNGALQSLCQHCHDSVKHTIEVRGYSTEIGLDGWPVDRDHPCYVRQRR